MEGYGGRVCWELGGGDWGVWGLVLVEGEDWLGWGKSMGGGWWTDFGFVLGELVVRYMITWSRYDFRGRCGSVGKWGFKC